eukprot:878662_1
MDTKADDDDDAQEEMVVDRYENKVEEMNSIALISALLFGFSITLWIEYDQHLFADEGLLAFIFTISALTTIVSSALSTVLAISIAVSLRRLMFKYGRQTNKQSLRHFKRSTHHLRHFVRYFVYLSYFGLFVALAVYSHVKWQTAGLGDFLFVVCYIILVIGLVMMIGIYCKVKVAYDNAFNEGKSND